MTLHDFREHVLKLKGKITNPDDQRDLEHTIKAVAEWRFITETDAKLLTRLREQYAPMDES